MGRGRTGLGYMRFSNVNIKIEQINFQAYIEKSKSASKKRLWRKRELMVQDLKGLADTTSPNVAATNAAST